MKKIFKDGNDKFPVEFKIYGHDMFWECSEIIWHGSHIDYISARISGYDDANWWNNVITQKDQNADVVKANNRFYKVVFDVYNGTAEIYLLRKNELKEWLEAHE